MITQRLAVSLIGICLLALGCKQRTEDSNLQGVSTLVMEAHKLPEAYIDSVKSEVAKYPKFIVGDDQDLVLRNFALIPKVYRQELYNMYEKKDFEGIKVEGTPSSYSGITSGQKPYWVRINGTNLKSNADQALRGRVAYALFDKIAADADLTRDQLQGHMSTVVTEGRKSSKVNSFTQGRSEDYFAEVFDDFYHSERSRKFLLDELPRTYSLASKLLVQPDWLNIHNP